MFFAPSFPTNAPAQPPNLLPTPPQIKLMAAKREETVALDVLVEELQKLLKPRGEDGEPSTL